MKTRRQRESLGKPYAEAFPHFDVHDVQRASDRGGAALHEWVDEDGLVIGFAEGRESSAKRFMFSYRFFGTRNIEPGAGEEIFDLRWKMAGAHWKKPSFVCPGCGQDRTKIFYLGGMWRCKACHNLINLAQRLNQYNKALWHHQTISEQLRVKPLTAQDRRRREKYKAKNGRAALILSDNTHLGTELPDRFGCRAHGRWLAEGELPKMKVFDGEVGYGWGPGDVGQFDGLDTRELVGGGTGARVSSRASAGPPGPESSIAGPDRTPDSSGTGEIHSGFAHRRAELAAEGARVQPRGEQSNTPEPSGPKLRPGVSPWFGDYRRES